MPMPTLTTTGQELYDALAPLALSEVPGYSDAENGYALAILCAGLATMVDPVSDVVRDQSDGTPGYGILFNPQGLVNNNMDQWLPWVAQFVGDSQAVQAATTTEQMVSIITNPRNFLRGRPATIRAAAQDTLTGTQTVLFSLNYGGNPFVLSVATLISETPNPTATLNAVMAQIPAWVQVIYATVTGGSYATLAASHASYSLMEAAHTTYADIAAHPAA